MFLRLIAVALIGFCMLGQARAQGAASWHGDLGSARAFMVDAAKAYELKRKTKVTVKALGSMSALEALAQGRVDLVCSARIADPRTPLEQGLEFVPVAWDSLVLITHPANPVKNLTLKQLQDIYAGRITSWNQVGGPTKTINLYAVAGPNDGIEYSLRRLLFGAGSVGVAAHRWYINTQQLEDAIAIDISGLGVSLLSNVNANRGIKRLSIDGVVPGIKTLESAQYLLATPLFVVARREAPGQTSSLPQARRALEFIRDEPALRNAWRAKQLLPIESAKRLSDGQVAREQLIASTLDIHPLRLVPAGPPVPPAPVKGKMLNNRHLASAVIRRVPIDKPPAAAPAMAHNALRTGMAPPKVGLCRPQSICLK